MSDQEAFLAMMEHAGITVTTDGTSTFTIESEAARASFFFHDGGKLDFVQLDTFGQGGMR
jgi:hypothetical protein